VSEEVAMGLTNGRVKQAAALAVLAASLFLPCSARAVPVWAADGEPISLGTYRKLRSEVLKENRLMLVSLPRGYGDSTLSYPVLFVLYADQVRGYYAEAVHIVSRLSDEGSVPQMVVVGVANVDRYRDLSPAEQRGTPSGIEAFLRFFEEELVPFVEREYRVKDYRVLAGPQAGAAFGLHSLGEHPGLFDAVVVENPFQSDTVHAALQPAVATVLERGFASPVFLHVTASDRAGYRDMTDALEHLRDFERAVTGRNPFNLRLRVSYVEQGEDFLPPLGLREGLRELFRGYRMPDDSAVEGLADVAGHYSRLSESLGLRLNIPERVLVASSDRLSSAGKSAEALELLEHVIDVYPTSLDGHWRLGNLLRELGDTSGALKHYKRCLELMPNMRPASEWIERLESKEALEHD
jgi:predicted alpha/beta superfamily hydrolase